MSNRTKRATIWFRFKFKYTPNVRANIIKEADRLFAVTGVEERRQFTEEEVVNMVHNAILKTTDYKYTPKLYSSLREAAYEFCHNCMSLRLDREEDILDSESLIEGNCPFRESEECFCRKWWALLKDAKGVSHD